MRTACVLVTVLVGCAPPPDAPDPQRLVMDKLLPGYSAMSLSGPLLYAGSGEGITIFDLKDGVDAEKVGAYATSNSLGYAETPGLVSVRGKALYYLGGDPGAHVLDLSDPLVPVQVRMVPDFDRFAIRTAITAPGQNLVAAGSTNVDGAVVLFDVSDPLDPRPLNTFRPTTEKIRGLTVDGTTLYLSQLDAVLVIDVSNPSAPSTPIRLNGVAALLFVAAPGVIYCGAGHNASGQQAILDARDPQHPVFKDPPANASSWLDASYFHRSSHWIYLGINPSGPQAGTTQAYDVRDPLAPVYLSPVGTLSTVTSNHASYGMVSNSQFLIIQAENGLQIYETPKAK